MKNAREHYYWLDLMRFIAAYLVVLAHYRHNFFEDSSLLSTNGDFPSYINDLISLVTCLGHPAVLIFFVLSGYLVGGGILLKIKRLQFNFTKYAIDRFVRISLPLFCAVLFIAVVNLITGDCVPTSRYIANLLSLQGICEKPLVDPFWSLSYEVWYYIIFGLLGLVITRPKPIYIIAFASCFLIYAYNMHVYNLIIWIMGALFVLIRITPNKKNVIISLICLAISTMLVFCDERLISISVMTHNTFYCIYNLLFGLSSCYTIIILSNMEYTNKFTRTLNEYGSKFAAFSYTLYLTHWPVMNLLDYFGVPHFDTYSIASILMMLVYTIISIVTAYLLYLLFEKHTYTVKNVFYKFFKV